MNLSETRAALIHVDGDDFDVWADGSELVEVVFHSDTDHNMEILSVYYDADTKRINVDVG